MHMSKKVSYLDLNCVQQQARNLRLPRATMIPKPEQRLEPWLGMYIFHVRPCLIGMMVLVCSQ